jgi:ribonuclease D
VSHRRSRRAQQHADAERGHDHRPEAASLAHPLVPAGAHELLESAAAVEDFVAHVREFGVLAFDTEFIGEESFRPKICLVQAATAQRVALLDPLSGVDPMPIYRLVADPAVLTIVHAGEQDMTAVRQAIGGAAHRLVDTQIAASMVGLPWPSSLGNTIDHFAGIRLQKAHTFTEWDRRPLSKSQLRYAADDVRYLPLVWDRIRERLETLGRMEWAMQESAAQLEGEPAFDPERQMRRASRGEPLRPAVMVLLRELVLLRRELAEQEDQPQRTLLSDGALLELARRKPESLKALREIRYVPIPVIERHGARIVECLQRAKSMPPIRQEFERLLEDGAVKARIDAMWLAFQARCLATDVAPNLVTSRADFTAWLAARIDRERRVARGQPVDPAAAPFADGEWRAACAGRWLDAFVEGRCDLSLRWNPAEGALRTDGPAGGA